MIPNDDIQFGPIEDHPEWVNTLEMLRALTGIRKDMQALTQAVRLLAAVTAQAGTIQGLSETSGEPYWQMALEGAERWVTGRHE